MIPDTIPATQFIADNVQGPNPILIGLVWAGIALVLVIVLGVTLKWVLPSIAEYTGSLVKDFKKGVNQ